MIEEALLVLAKAHSGLTALIGSGNDIRFYPETEEREHAAPRVVYANEDQDPIAGIWSDSGWYHTIFSFTAWGSSALAAKEVIDQVRDCFQRYHSNGAVVSGTSHKIDDVLGRAVMDAGYDHDIGQFWEAIELEFFHD